MNLKNIAANVTKVLTLVFCCCMTFASSHIMAGAAEKAAEGGNSAVSSPMAVVELERLDKRKPVPLSAKMANHQKENMRGHLEAVQAIIRAVSSEDYRSVEKPARTMGYSEEMKQMCTNMGAGAPGFAELAIQFHKTADTIAEAARFKDRVAVLRSLDATLQTCTGCHAQFRQQIVDDQNGAMQHAPGHGKK